MAMSLVGVPKNEQVPSAPLVCANWMSSPSRSTAMFLALASMTNLSTIIWKAGSMPSPEMAVVGALPVELSVELEESHEQMKSEQEKRVPKIRATELGVFNMRLLCIN